MRDPLITAHRYRKVAAEFSNYAKSASSDFPSSYYKRVAQRYQSLADDELGWGRKDVVKRSANPANSDPGARVVNSWCFDEQVHARDENRPTTYR